MANTTAPVQSLQTQLWLSHSIDEIWAFHCNPENLVKISPDFLKLTLKNVPEKLGKGSSFQIHTDNKYLKGLLKWNVEYIDWSDEADVKFFVDLQKDGPFEYWKHKHEFRRGTKELVVGGKKFAAKNEGTWIVDSVEYSLKPQFRRVSWVAEKMITQLFVFRKRRLEKLFKRQVSV